MNFCAKLIFLTTLLPSLLWGQISHTYIEHQNFSTVKISSTEPAHLNPEGVILNSISLISNTNTPLPTTITFKTPSSPSKLIVYACLNNGQCLKPYETTLGSLNKSLTQMILTSIVLALSTVFNPCLAPLWLIVSSQIKKHLLAHSFFMGALLLTYQSLLQIFGTQLITLTHQLGINEAAYLFLLTCLIMVLFSNKISLPALIKNHSKWPSFLAIILSSTCLLPIQLSATGVTSSMPIDLLAIGAIIFYITTSLGFWAIASISQKLYKKLMAYTPIAIRIIATTALLYLITQHQPSTPAIVYIIALISYLTFKPPRNNIDLAIWSILISTTLTQSLITHHSFGHTLQEIETAKVTDNHKLYVVADWCPTCQKLKSNPPSNALWLDITHSSSLKDKWINAHQVSFLPSCFVSKNNQWQPCI
jgi:hypothetical protein